MTVLNYNLVSLDTLWLSQSNQQLMSAVDLSVVALFFLLYSDNSLIRGCLSKVIIPLKYK